MTPEEVRAAQRARVLADGGRVLKFTNNGGELYFRYYFPQPEALTWTKLVDGLRVLYSITSPKMYIRYADADGTKITVNDSAGLAIMLQDTKASDVIRIEVFDPEGLDVDAGPRPPGSGTPTTPHAGLQMPMPMFDQQPGFPGLDDTRPHSVISARPNAGPMPQPPPLLQSAGPVPHFPPQSVGAGPIPVHAASQVYNQLNASSGTLPPPRPQKPLD
ncbi:hypothetical protein H4R21_000028 [Coemansia helicoidea]|uniref:Uncharacterized protein n=1 Tax=Coemansia helicoidea TaxID=1286919 RepID=A0ACC1LHK9_9FUNG|nr:hypothetical protein H4R21_000028 [Coemansia helicoidea]